MISINVLISDDHTIVRDGLKSLLSAAEAITVVGEAESGRQAVSEAKRLRPDVVLLDLAMPLLNGVEATRQILKALPATRVLILSSYSSPHHVNQAIAAGAAGYVLKETAANDLLVAIREVHSGNAYFSPLITKNLYQNLLRRGSPSPAINQAKLSARQMETLQLIAEGYVTKQIAQMLSITVKTVERHRQALMDKLDIHGIADLTRYACANGVVEVDRVLRPTPPANPMFKEKIITAEPPPSLTPQCTQTVSQPTL
jgi:DNA-binding NarL/FixJ family response regulator